MNWGEWIAAGLALLTVLGTAVKLTWWLGDKLDKITAGTAKLISDHELKDEERHREVVQRLTTVETIVLNGSVRRGYHS